jgi:DNA repair protein RadC
VSIGLIDRSPVHPREVFADALSDRASAVIVAHNHPSGGLEPSPSDIAITAKLKAAGEVVGIELLDHIIFNRTGYTEPMSNFGLSIADDLEILGEKCP